MSIEQTVSIAASPETVWELLTTPDGLCSWWGAAAEVELHHGGVYRVAMEGGPIMRGEVVEADPPRRLVFTFGWEEPPDAGPMPPGSSRVEIALRAENGTTVLDLFHSELPEVQLPGHRDGWNYFLGQRLVAEAENRSS